MNKRVVFHIPCHRQELAERSAPGSLTMNKPEWWVRRAKVFESVTMPSLLAQTCKDFDVILTLRDQDNNADNPLVKVARDAGFSFFTQPYYPWRYPLSPAFHKPIVEKYKGLDWLIIAQLESDDAYAQDVAKLLYTMPMSKGLVFHFDIGYAYGYKDHKLCEYGIDNFPGSFFGYVYNTWALASAGDFDLYRRLWRHDFFHYNAPKAPNSTRMPNGKCFSTMHNANDSAGWKNPHVRKRVRRWIEGEDERRAIFARFGMVT